MNKRRTQEFIDKFTKIAVKNAEGGLVTTDRARGQLSMLHQLSLVALHDIPLADKISAISYALHTENYDEARELAGVKKP